MPRHATRTSFKAGYDPRTGHVAMSEIERKKRRHVYYLRHKKTTIQQTWEKQIRALGWTPEHYEQALQEQGRVCFLCLCEDKKRLCADHSHRTGKPRHLLCGRCNRVLGLVEENIGLLKRMEAYCAE